MLDRGPVEPGATAGSARRARAEEGVSTLDSDAILRVYRRYARRYDVYFGPVLHPGRKAVVRGMACRPGERVLEVGVGTGLSLPLYPDGVHVTGIDLSPEMLQCACERVRAAGLEERVELLVMDAEHLAFADDSFDKVVAMYVASVVSDPVRLVAEMRRVCRPGGELCIVNHFHSSRPLVAKVERALAPLARLIGFRPDFSYEWFMQATHLEVAECTRANLLGLSRVLRAPNIKGGGRAAGHAHAAAAARVQTHSRLGYDEAQWPTS